MKVQTPGCDELPELFGADDVSPVGEIPSAVKCLVRELGEMVAPDAILWLARDREQFIVGLIEGDESFESLYFTDEGKIAHGGTNHPAYVDKVEDLPPF